MRSPNAPQRPLGAKATVCASTQPAPREHSAGKLQTGQVAAQGLRPPGGTAVRQGQDSKRASLAPQLRTPPRTY